MTDPRDLISAATPLPWLERTEAGTVIGPSDGKSGYPVTLYPGNNSADTALAQYAVNNLPALLDVADAAQLRRTVLINNDYDFTGRWVAIPRADFDALRAALARLQESRDGL